MTSTYSNVVRKKKKNIVAFTDSILKTLHMGELNCYIDGGKVHLNSFPGSKVNQLNHYIYNIYSGRVSIRCCCNPYVGINDLLKGMSNNSLPVLIM